MKENRVEELKKRKDNDGGRKNRKEIRKYNHD